MIFTWRGVKMLPCTGPSSAISGLIHLRAVRSLTCQRAASWHRVIGWRGASLILDDFEGVWLFQGFEVDGSDGRLEGRVVLHVVFPLDGVVGGGEEHEVRGVGEELWRHGGHAVANGDDVDVVVPRRNQQDPPRMVEDVLLRFEDRFLLLLVPGACSAVLCCVYGVPCLVRALTRNCYVV